jgi:cytidylate kinase
MSLERTALERCQAFVDSNFVRTPPAEKRKLLAVTISRQPYSGSHAVGEALIEMLQHDKHLGGETWALFDRDLVHKILEDHNLPKALAQYMAEDKDHDFTGLINEILGLHPSLWELFHHTCDTVYKLAKVGNVVLIGRGAHIITRNLQHVLHVRIIAPFEQRVQNAARYNDLTDPAARKHVKQEDQAREAFVRSHFDESLDNPLAYHLTLNTGRLAPRDAAKIILTALHRMA